MPAPSLLMDVDKFAAKTIKVAGTIGVTLKLIEYIDPDYTYILHPNRNDQLTQKGWIVAAELNHKNYWLPRFFFHWDYKGNELDIDIWLNGEDRKDLWSPETGYKGHKTVHINQEGRSYKADIWIPGRQIFKGTIEIGLVYSQILNEKIGIKDSVFMRIKKFGYWKGKSKELS